MNEQELNKALDERLGPLVATAIADALKAAEKSKETVEREIPLGRLTRDRKFTLKPEDKGIAAARYVRALAFGRGSMERARYFASKAFNDDLGDEVQKALTSSNLTEAGALIPPEYAAEIIELLYARTVVRAAGARTLPMNSGSLTIRKTTAGSSAAYVGESQDIGIDQPSVGLIELTSKKLATIVPISNDLLAFTSGPSADQFVRDDLVFEMSIREDRAFLRDDGTSHTPKGMKNWAIAGNVTVSNGILSTDIEADFKDLINGLENNNVRLLRPAWFMHPSRKNHLINLRTSTGNLIFPEMRGASPTLYSYPVFVTTSIPNNLGAGTDSEVMFADMVDAIIGEATGLEIAVDSSAAYVENGNVQSAFSRDETLIRAISRHDFAMRHGESVAVKTGVAWGA